MVQVLKLPLTRQAPVQRLMPHLITISTLLTKGITSKRGQIETFKMSQSRQIAAVGQTFKRGGGYHNPQNGGGRSRGNDGKFSSKGKTFQSDGKTL